MEDPFKTRGGTLVQRAPGKTGPQDRAEALELFNKFMDIPFNPTKGPLPNLQAVPDVRLLTQEERSMYQCQISRKYFIHMKSSTNDLFL